jgi:hypothetical protein
MSEARPIIVAFSDNEDLGLVLKASERGRMEDTISITLKGCAIVRLVLRVLPAAGFATPVPVGSKGFDFEFFQSFTRDHGRLSVMIAAVHVNKV